MELALDIMSDFDLLIIRFSLCISTGLNVKLNLYFNILHMHFLKMTIIDNVNLHAVLTLYSNVFGRYKFALWFIHDFDIVPYEVSSTLRAERLSSDVVTWSTCNPPTSLSEWTTDRGTGTVHKDYQQSVVDRRLQPALSLSKTKSTRYAERLLNSHEFSLQILLL